jgi:hypothetical protein
MVQYFLARAIVSDCAVISKVKKKTNEINDSTSLHILHEVYPPPHVTK